MSVEGWSPKSVSLPHVRAHALGVVRYEVFGRGGHADHALTPGVRQSLQTADIMSAVTAAQQRILSRNLLSSPPEWVSMDPCMCMVSACVWYVCIRRFDFVLEIENPNIRRYTVTHDHTHVYIYVCQIAGDTPEGVDVWAPADSVAPVAVRAFSRCDVVGDRSTLSGDGGANGREESVVER